MLAAPKVGAPVKWVEDRRENLLAAGQVAPRARRRHDGVRRRRRDPGRPHRLRLRLRRVPHAVAGRPGGRGGHAVPRAVPRAARGFATKTIYTNTVGRTAYRGPWQFEIARPRDAARHRGAPDGHGPDRAPPAQPAPPRRPAVREPERHDLRQHLADARRSSRPWRCSTTTRSAPSRPRPARRSLPRRRLSQLRRAVDARLRLLRDRGGDDPHRAVGRGERVHRRRLDREQPRDDGRAAHRRRARREHRRRQHDPGRHRGHRLRRGRRPAAAARR